ncbi:hypothetical protein QBC37DRAFT_379701 [Rhypophila decipiens]|uniref:Uncharacterized protein n=1 Tax=Rhypophila decipiens TaxID=261697 RepID=A0AAN6XW59_9PEZI|nr:hypothetical protein QBC37DRAFT_379701 [Rhypophila decipiens]
MTPSASSPSFTQHGAKAVENAQKTTGPTKKKSSSPKSDSKKSGASKVQGPAVLSCPRHPDVPYACCLQGVGGEGHPGPFQHRHGPSRASPPALSSRHESPWDEGTVYGRLACLDYHSIPEHSRDEEYCNRAAQAISDFEKKF